jgi:FAD/FMN-containing dehydrogenase
MRPQDAALKRLIERVRAAAAAQMPLEIRGGGTKIFYGNMPRGEPLELGELAGITCYEPTELFVTALAGTPLASVEAALAERGQCLPFEPPRFAPAGTVGGMVSAGLSGPARAGAGPLRDFVLGLSVLTGSAETLTFGGQVMKNVAGYDVSRVFAGALGILGVLCEVSLKVMPRAPGCATLSFDLDQTAALDRLHRWAAKPLPVSGSSWYRGLLHVRLDGARAAVSTALQRLGGTEMESAAAADWWDGVRDQRHEFFSISPAQLSAGECLWRVSVPCTAAPLTLPGEQFVEWGGALRWIRGRATAAEVRAAAIRLGGHATLFRAADKSAGAFTAVSAPLMQIHQRLKRSFDPAGIFNPGRLYPDL